MSPAHEQKIAIEPNQAVSASSLTQPDARAASRWVLKYNDRIYGPYSFEAMTSYIAEGRIAAHSLIAPEGTPAGAIMWQYAENTPAFFEYFGRAPAIAPVAATATDIERPVAAAVTTPAHAPSEHGVSSEVAQLKAIIESSSRPSPAPANGPDTENITKEPSPVGPVTADESQTQDRRYGSSKGQIDRRKQPDSSNFVVVTDIKSRYAGQLEQAIMSAGPAYKLAPNVWCLNADATATMLLNDLARHIGKTDSIVVVDATRDRAAWTTLGPETEAKMRRVWRRNF